MHPKISKILYLAVQKIRSENISQYLKELDKSQWFSPAELRELQWQKIKRLIDYAYQNVPYYTSLFKRLNLQPGDFKDFSDFKKIPVLTKREIKENLSDLYSEVKFKRLEKDATSGTSGGALAYVRSPLSSGMARAAQIRSWSWFGVDIGGRIGLMLTMTWSPRKVLRERIKDFIKNRFRISGFKFSSWDLETFYKRCRKSRPKVLYGLPSLLYGFAVFLEEKNINPRSLGIKIIFSSSELLQDYQKTKISQVFGCQVVDEYGASEVGIMAFECPAGNLHIIAENVYLEFLKNGEPAAPGESADIIVTELNNLAMPLIRYKIGDSGKFSLKICSCGRGLPVMEMIVGRILELIQLPDGRVLHGRIFDYINRELLSSGREIKEYQVLQRKIDKLVVRVLKREKIDKAVLEYWEKRIKDLLGKEMKVEFEFLDFIPLTSSGKHRYFISELIKPDGQK